MERKTRRLTDSSRPLLHWEPLGDHPAPPCGADQTETDGETLRAAEGGRAGKNTADLSGRLPMNGETLGLLPQLAFRMLADGYGCPERI